MKACGALLALLVLAGCKSGGEAEPTKDDFAKRPPPPGWHGPSSTPTGAAPPANAGKG